MSVPFEIDDGNGQWCENCLAITDEALALIGLPAEGNIINFDAASGRYLCTACEPNPQEI